MYFFEQMWSTMSKSRQSNYYNFIQTYPGSTQIVFPVFIKLLLHLQTIVYFCLEWIHVFPCGEQNVNTYYVQDFFGGGNIALYKLEINWLFNFLSIRMVIAKVLPCLGILLRISHKDSRSFSNPSTRRPTVTSQSSDINGLPRGHRKLSSVSDSESVRKSLIYLLLTYSINGKVDSKLKIDQIQQCFIIGTLVLQWISLLYFLCLLRKNTWSWDLEKVLIRPEIRRERGRGLFNCSASPYVLFLEIWDLLLWNNEKPLQSLCTLKKINETTSTN